MAKKGEVFFLETAKGRAYFQYHSRNKLMGELVRVIKGEYPSDIDVSSVVGAGTRFWIFFRIAAALKSGLISSCGVFPIPEDAKDFPVFRAGLRDKEGKIDSWWFWDGEKEWFVGHITDEQKKMPMRGIWGENILINRIESGWLPENDKS